MNSVQMHLALTHVPVILSLVGLVMLVVALLRRNTTLTQTSYIIIAVAGLAAVPVYFSGEEAEEAVEHIAGISESLIEEHEEVAKIAMFAIIASGILALAGLFAQHWIRLTNFLKSAILMTSFVAAGFMVQTAHLGGQIRHTEINGLVSGEMKNENMDTGGTSNDHGKNNDDD